MPGNLSGRMDGQTDGRTCRKMVTVDRVDQRTHVQVKRGYFRLRTDGRTDGQPENIMPPAPKGGGIKSSGNPIYGQIFGHQRAENEAWNTKMFRGQETPPIRVNARYEMNWANSFFKKLQKPHFRQMFGHQRAENEARNTEMYRGQETHPIRVNARNEMNWANVFFK